MAVLSIQEEFFRFTTIWMYIFWSTKEGDGTRVLLQLWQNRYQRNVA